MTGETSPIVPRIASQDILVHLDELHRYALALTGRRSDAEDLVQETYLRAAKACLRLNPNSNLKCWLFTILRNIFLNQTRSAWRSVHLDFSVSHGHVQKALADHYSHNPYVSFLKRSQEIDIRKKVEELPPVYREVVVLRDYQDLSYKEIAEVIGCPIGTVMSRLGRAREKLKQSLQHWDAKADLESSTSHTDTADQELVLAGEG
jgi:RNA polymerase sigma-70 factor, ECF subfamily